MLHASDWTEALEDDGIAVSGGPVKFPTGASALFVRDPDRNVIEYHCPAEADDNA